MSEPALIVTALLLWALGASWYTWQLWAARGLTDHGITGLVALILGSAAMAVALREIPTLAVCGLFPAYFAVAILVTKVRARIRVRWHQPLPERPAMLPRVPPITRADEVYDGAALTMGDFLRHEAREPLPDVGSAVDDAIARAEAERAQRMTKMFG